MSEFRLVYKEGESFQVGDVLAYNPAFFMGKGKNIDYKPGALARINLVLSS